MKPITTFLERLAQRQPSFILFNGHTYAISVDENTTDFLELNGLRFSLKPSLSYNAFENLDEAIQKAAIEEYCLTYVKEAIHAELKSEAEIEGEQERIKTLHFIVNEFLPYCLSRKYEAESFIGIEDLLGHEFDPVQKAKQEIMVKLNTDFPTLTAEVKEDPVQRLKQSILHKERLQQGNEPILPIIINPKIIRTETTIEDTSLLNRLTNGQPLYVFNGELFQLTTSRKKNDKVRIHINGKDYAPAYDHVHPLSGLLSEFAERRKQIWRINALERSQDIFEGIRGTIKEQETTEAQMHEMAKLKEYDLGNCGFVLRNGKYYVYARIPKFATQDGRDPNVFWPYESTRIAINLQLRSSTPRSSGRPLCVERRETHPCLKDRYEEREFFEICNLSREESNYENTIPDLLRKLSDGVNVFLHPLTKESLESHSGESYFGTTLTDILKQTPLKRQEAEQKGYRIIEVIPKEIAAEVRQ